MSRSRIKVTVFENGHCLGISVSLTQLVSKCFKQHRLFNLILSQTKNFTHFQIQNTCRRRKTKLVQVSLRSLVWKKKLLEKEKILVTSIFSSSHNAFRRFLSQRNTNLRLFGKVTLKVSCMAKKVKLPFGW